MLRKRNSYYLKYINFILILFVVININCFSNDETYKFTPKSKIISSVEIPKELSKVYNAKNLYSFKDNEKSFITINVDSNLNCNQNLLLRTITLKAKRIDICSSFLKEEIYITDKDYKVPIVVWVTPKSDDNEQKFYLESAICVDKYSIYIYAESLSINFIEENVIKLINSIELSDH